MAQKVQTKIGTSVIETPEYIRNPITGNRENMAELSQDGYKRKFLAMMYKSNRPNVIDFSESKMLSFNKEKWGLEECDDYHILARRYD